LLFARWRAHDAIGTFEMVKGLNMTASVSETTRLPASFLEQTEALQQLLETAALYLHIPFCHTRCYYCDFNTYAGILPLRESYVRALTTEITLAGNAAQHADGRPRRSRSIFFGGGTPSLLSVEQVTRLLNACFTSFAVDKDAEITLEANPGTLTQAQLASLRAAGVNRLSMGAQSFDAALLKTLGRIHSPEEVEQALRYARTAGFTSVNLDLMFGLPGQTMQHWRDTLARALDLHPDHFSLYSLIIEEGTPFYDWTREGRITPGDEDLCADMYEYADELLQEAGYVNYEISNWARPGKQSIHNLTYWQNLPYIGMGAGAYSYFSGRRYSNERAPATYIKQLRAGRMPEVESEQVSRQQEMSETAFLALRTAMGLHLPTFEQRFGQSFAQFVGDHLRIVDEAHLLEYAGEWLRLSRRGRLLGNEVFMRLLPD
jgi:oxygen-independent coproporphyrinogen-3 oxidase